MWCIDFRVINRKSFLTTGCLFINILKTIGRGYRFTVLGGTVSPSRGYRFTVPRGYRFTVDNLIYPQAFKAHLFLTRLNGGLARHEHLNPPLFFPQF